MWKDSITNNIEPQTAAHLFTAVRQDWNKAGLQQMHSAMVTLKEVSILWHRFMVYASCCKMCAV